MDREIVDLLEKDCFVNNGDFIYLQDLFIDRIHILFVAQTGTNIAMLFDLRDCNRWNGCLTVVQKVDNKWCYSLRQLLNWEKIDTSNYNLQKIKIQRKDTGDCS